MADIVALGSGLGRTLVAYEPVSHMRTEDCPTVVGWREREDIEVDLDAVMSSRGMRYRPQRARRVHPKENRVELEACCTSSGS